MEIYFQNVKRQESSISFHVQKATDPDTGDKSLNTQELTRVIERTVGPLAYQTVIYRQIAPQIV